MNDISALFAEAGGSLSDSILQGLGGGGSPPTISLKDDRFAFVDEAGERTPHPELKLRCIIIGVNPHGPSKVFWGRAYTGSEGEQARPACFSDNGIGPSQQSQEPQSATCKACPHNEWGSAVSNMTGKGIKACQDRKKLAVIIPDHNSGTVWLLNIPPASFSNLAAYVKRLGAHNQNGRKVELYDVITELSIESKQLNFAPKAQIDQKAMETILGIWKEGTAKEVVGANDTPIKGLLEAPKKVEQIEAPKIIGSARITPIESKGLDFQKLNSDIVEKRPPGRPRKEPLAVEGIAREEDIPAFLKPKPSTRGGVVSNPEPVPAGLASALEDAFKLSLE